uniref:Reverse transcriptase zinc-binding domain-containing protein n=1 Tax=Cannabis sativa TaxID=3483 RepID=A0A803Q0W5_CANSA
MESLSRRLKKERTKNSFRFHPMCKSLNLVSLYFADDLILFSKGSPMVVHHLKIALESFSEVTALFPNKDKSLAYFGGVFTVDKKVILEDLHMGEGTFPLKACSAYSLVLLGLRNYWMSIFILPQSVIKEVEKLYRGFLWGIKGEKSKIHLASWDLVCLPKPFGGLGFKNGPTWNRSILGKFIWAIMDKHDILWVKWVVHGNLLTRDNFSKLHIALDSCLCPVCGLEEESHSHIFFNCRLSKEVLQEVSSWCGAELWPSNFTRWKVWLANSKAGVRIHLAAATVYML